jgi:hypothetical protein
MTPRIRIRKNAANPHSDEHGYARFMSANAIGTEP